MMKLDLYMFPGCPYCRRVISVIDSQGRKDITLHNIHANEQDRQTLDWQMREDTSKICKQIRRSS